MKGFPGRLNIPTPAHGDSVSRPRRVPAGSRYGGAARPSTSGRPSRRPGRRPTQEATITTPIKPASWSYAEAFVAEDEVLAAARARADEVGVVPIGSGGGAALRFLASVLDARAVVEIGTGTGRLRRCGCCAACAPTAC